MLVLRSPYPSLALLTSKPNYSASYPNLYPSSTCDSVFFLKSKNDGVEEDRAWFNDPAVLIVPSMENEQRIKRFGFLVLQMQCRRDHKTKSQIN